MFTQNAFLKSLRLKLNFYNKLCDIDIDISYPYISQFL